MSSYRPPSPAGSGNGNVNFIPLGNSTNFHDDDDDDLYGEPRTFTQGDHFSGVFPLTRNVASSGEVSDNEAEPGSPRMQDENEDWPRANELDLLDDFMLPSAPPPEDDDEAVDLALDDQMTKVE